MGSTLLLTHSLSLFFCKLFILCSSMETRARVLFYFFYSTFKVQFKLPTNKDTHNIQAKDTHLKFTVFYFVFFTSFLRLKSLDCIFCDLFFIGGSEHLESLHKEYPFSFINILFLRILNKLSCPGV